MLLVVVCGLKYGQNNERQELFDKWLVNTEKWGPAQRQKKIFWTRGGLCKSVNLSSIKRLLKELTL